MICFSSYSRICFDLCSGISQFMRNRPMIHSFLKLMNATIIHKRLIYSCLQSAVNARVPANVLPLLNALANRNR